MSTSQFTTQSILHSPQSYYAKNIPSEIYHKHQSFLLELYQMSTINGKDLEAKYGLEFQMELMVYLPHYTPFDTDTFLPFLFHLFHYDISSASSSIQSYIQRIIHQQHQSLQQLSFSQCIPDIKTSQYHDLILWAHPTWVPFLLHTYPSLCSLNPRYIETQIVRLCCHGDFSRLHQLIRSNIISKRSFHRIISRYYPDILSGMTKHVLRYTLETCTNDDMIDAKEEQNETDKELEKETEIDIPHEIHSSSRVGYFKVQEKYQQYQKTLEFVHRALGYHSPQFIQWIESKQGRNILQFIVRYYLSFLLEPIMTMVQRTFPPNKASTWISQFRQHMMSGNPSIFRCYTSYSPIKIWMTRYLFNDKQYYAMCRLFDCPPERQISDFYT